MSNSKPSDGTTTTVDAATIKKLFEAHPLFSTFTPKKQKPILEALIQSPAKVFKAGQTIATTDTNTPLLIVDGSARVPYEKSVQTLRSGDLIGLAPAIFHSSHRQHSYDVIAAATDETDTTTVLQLNAHSITPITNGIRELHITNDYALNVRTGCTSNTGEADEDGKQVVRIAFYDSKPYQVEEFNRVASIYEEKHKIKFEFKLFDVRLNADTVALCRGCPIVCVFVNDNIDKKIAQLLAAQRVRLVAIRAAGFNNVDLHALDQLRITVARVPAYSPYAVAEFATALLLALNRKTHHAYNRVRDYNFSLNRLVGFDLHGKTVGVFGTGKIGRCFIDIMLGFGCKVVCYDVYEDASLKQKHNVTYKSMDDVFAEADVISLHLPLLKDTKHLINKKNIAKMKKNVIIINTGRGQLVNTHDVLEALRNERIGGCGLDVYEEEEAYFYEDKSEYVMKDEQLLQLIGQPNVLLTSHQAFLTHEALTGIATTTLDNVLEFIQGKRLHELTNSLNKKPDNKKQEGSKSSGGGDGGNQTVKANKTSGHVHSRVDPSIASAVLSSVDLMKHSNNTAITARL